MTVTEIADKLKINEKNLEKQVKRVKIKCVDTQLLNRFGYSKQDINGKTNDEKKQLVIAYMLTENGNKKEFARFNGVGEASRTLGIDKNSIRKVANGKRKTAGGYVFEYANAIK